MTVPYIDNIKLMLIVELVEKEGERLPKKKFSKLMNLNIPKNKNIWKKFIICYENKIKVE